jgi:hypothetical protein
LSTDSSVRDPARDHIRDAADPASGELRRMVTAQPADARRLLTVVLVERELEHLEGLLVLRDPISLDGTQALCGGRVRPSRPERRSRRVLRLKAVAVALRDVPELNATSAAARPPVQNAENRYPLLGSSRMFPRHTPWILAAS